MIIWKSGRFLCHKGHYPELSRELLHAGWVPFGSYVATQNQDLVVPYYQHFSHELQLLTKQHEYVLPEIDINKYGEFIKPDNGFELEHYQKEDIVLLLDWPNVLLAEEAGMGKSAIMIVAANMMDAHIRKIKRGLILTPATVKRNWLQKEWPRWSTLTHLSVGVVVTDDWPDTDIVIMNPDIFDRHKKRIDDTEWDFLWADESHKYKTEGARRTKLLLGGSLNTKKENAEKMGLIGAHGKYWSNEVKAFRRVFASATPLDRPRDLWTTVKAFDPKGLGRDFNEYAMRYCAAFYDTHGLNTKGASNLVELGYKMRCRFMARHEVKGLPPMQEEIILLSEDTIEMQELESHAQQFIAENIASLMALSRDDTFDIPSELRNLKEDETEKFVLLIGATMHQKMKFIKKPEYEPMFTEFSRLREMTGRAKVPAVVDYLREKTDNGSFPTVIMAYHRSVIEKLREAFPDHVHVVGGMSEEKKREAIVKFDSGQVPWFIGQVNSAGEGIDLVASRYLCFAETDWQGSVIKQARKRIHRLSQKSPVLIEYLVADKTFDAFVAPKAIKKIDDANEVLDDSLSDAIVLPEWDSPT
jgi:hypothetical protein